MFKWRGQH